MVDKSAQLGGLQFTSYFVDSCLKISPRGTPSKSKRMKLKMIKAKLAAGRYQVPSINIARAMLGGP